MHNFFEKLRWNMQRFMVGRYGVDALSLAMVRTAMVLLLLTWFHRSDVLSGVSSALVFLSLFRSLSKNFYSRQQELSAYQTAAHKMQGFLSLQKRKWDDRKTHRYFRCQCGKIVRVPKGVGKIEIRCPACGRTFIKKV